MELTVFYDGMCPLCVREMQHLHRLDTQQRMQLVDIQAPDFHQQYPHINPQEASRILHGQWQDGRVIKGLDVTHATWTLVGKGYYTAALRWPIIRWFADRAYLFFAQHRYRISALLTGQARCERCEIGDKSCTKN